MVRTGPSACGSLGFALADSVYADRVIVVTDNLVPFPCIPWQIQGNNVDYVVEVDSIGDPSKIVSGTTQITRSPDRLRISELVARFIRDSGIMRDGFSFQAGAGGIALAFVDYLARMMKQANVKAGFVRGGSTKYLVDLLNQGLIGYILDGQTFDLDAVRSIASNPRHVATSPFTSYNFHGKGNFASMVDAAVLGATEVDVNFNANVVTHSDGRLLHGIGGWQNCLFAGCTILAVPSFRDRIPVIVDEVTTLTGPGELIDVVATERGIAINPRRQDLLDAVKGKGLPIRSHRRVASRSGEDLRRQTGQASAARSSRGCSEMGGRNRARHRVASGGRQSLCAESKRRRTIMYPSRGISASKATPDFLPTYSTALKRQVIHLRPTMRDYRLARLDPSAPPQQNRLGCALTRRLPSHFPRSAPRFEPQPEWKHTARHEDILCDLVSPTNNFAAPSRRSIVWGYWDSKPAIRLRSLT